MPSPPRSPPSTFAACAAEPMLTKPDKVLIPAADGHDAVTKADVFDYATRTVSYTHLTLPTNREV